jgi:5-methylcytosine-specific restriction protein A
MQELMDVVLGYGATRKSGRVSRLPATADKIAVEVGIPTVYASVLARSGRSGYKVKGSFGQTNFTPAQCPWVAVFNRDITASAQTGYYVVLLFAADLSRCWLSLNQGYTAFKEQFLSDALASSKLELVAARAGQYIGDPPGLQKGIITLATSSSLAKGYERGAIASFEYDAQKMPTRQEFERDLEILLHMYDELHQKFGASLLSLMHLADSDFQADINDLAVALKQIPPEPPGAESPPPMLPGKLGNRYARNGKKSAEALVTAGFACEYDSTHDTFTSAKHGNRYVEGHHLIPMSAQSTFLANLDVRANIVSLCPTCHRLLHHGITGDKTPILAKLLGERTPALLAKGINVNVYQVQKLYSKDLPELDA